VCKSWLVSSGHTIPGKGGVDDGIKFTLTLPFLRVGAVDELDYTSCEG